MYEERKLIKKTSLGDVLHNGLMKGFNENITSAINLTEVVTYFRTSTMCF